MAGLDLCRPPVVIWQGVTTAAWTTLLRGVDQTSRGAGGFGQVNAIPTLIRVRQPANPNSRAAQGITPRYGPQGLRTKARINLQFGT